MGRRKGNLEDQAALGHPGKRKTKTERAIAEAERQAALLALPRSDNAAEAPTYLTDPRLAPALAVWSEYAPRLDKLHLLAQLDRHTFGLFCIYAAEFVVANEDILAKGYSVMVKTISGDKMPRENPSVGRRDHAAKMVVAMSERFGLTPADRNRLLRDSAMRFDDETLFGRALPQPEKPVAAEQAATVQTHDAAAIGSMANFDSVPPGAKPN